MICEKCGAVFCWDYGADIATLGGSRKRFCSRECRNDDWKSRLKEQGKRADDESASCPSGKICWPTEAAARDAALEAATRGIVLAKVYACRRSDRFTDHWHTSRRES
jgi:hypothetical protein